MAGDQEKMRAEQAYVAGDMTLSDLAKSTALPLPTLKRWCKEGQWVKKRKKLHERAMKKALTRAVGKKAKELEKLLEASGEIEMALLWAARGLRVRLEGDPTGQRFDTGTRRAVNLNAVTSAIGRQAETRMLLSGILTEAEAQKLDLLERKTALEERQAEEKRQEGQGVSLALDKEAEELSE